MPELNKIVQRMLDAGESEDSIKSVVEEWGKRESTGLDIGGPDPIPEFSHTSVEDFEIKIGDSIWNKEENASDYLTKHYRNQGLDVRFVQTGKLKNRLKMLVGQEREADSDKIIDLSAGRSWKDLRADIERRVDSAFNPEKTKKVDQAILEIYKGHENAFFLDGGENIIGQKTNPSARAKLATVGDMKTNPNRIVDKQDMTVNEYISSLQESYGYSREEATSVAIEHGWKSNRVSRSDAMFTMFGEEESADMTGGITVKMDNGEETFVPYTYLWDRKAELKKLSLENMNVNLTTEKIAEFGTKEALNQYIEDNAHIYFTPKERELYVLQRELEGVEDEDSKADVEGKIQTQLSKMYPNYSKEDREAMVLYNEDGKFIRIKKPPPEEGTAEAEIEDNASSLASMNDLDYLTKERQQAYIELINLAKIAYANSADISEQQSLAMSALENIVDASEGKWTSDKNWSKDLKNLKRVAETNDIFGLEDVTEFGKLSGLPDGTTLGNEFDAALRKFRTLSRAVDLNIDISRTPEETVFKEFVGKLRENITGVDQERDEDEARDVFQSTLEFDGYKVPDHVIESTFWKNGRLGKNNNYRKVVEGGSDVIADLAPLLIELAVFKKAGGLKSLKTAWGGLATRLTPASTNPIVRKIINKLIVPGLITTSEWSLAEVAGQSILGTQHGDAWKAHTVNLETGETNFTMPFVMGMSGPLFAKFSQATMAKFGEYSFGKSILSKLQNPDGWLRKTRGGRILSESTAHLKGAVGGGTTATTLLVVAETAQANIDALMKEGRFVEAERMKEILDVEHLMSTWLAMTVLSGKDVSPKVREMFRTDVANLKRNTRATEEAYKELDVNENSTTLEVEAATQKKLDAIYENAPKYESGKKKGQITAKGKKEVDAKVDRILKQNKTLKLDKIIKDVRDTAIKEGRYYKDFVLPRWEVMNNLSTKSADTWKAEDYNQVSKLTHNELYQVLRRSGIEPGTKDFERYESIHETVIYLTKWADALGLDASLPKFREGYIRNTLTSEFNNFRISELKEQIKSGKEVSRAKLELKKLEETNNKILEKNEILYDQAQVEWNKKLEGEVASAEVLAESLGKTIQTYGKGGKFTSKEWKEKGFEENVEGAYDGKVLSINLDVIRETRNLGAPIHEVTHHILKNSLKNPEGHPKEGKISEKGKAVIDGLLKKFSPKERAIIEKRVEENYKYDEVTKEEKHWSEYYEEYVTGIGDAIKNKHIKYDKNKFREVGKLIYPILKPLMPNLYKYDINQENSDKASKDLFNMLGDIHLSSASRRVKKGLKELSETKGAEGEIIADIAFEAHSKSTESKFKAPINKIGEKVGKVIDGKKFTIEDMIVELYGETGKGELPQLVKFQLKPYEKNPGFSYEEMVGETIVEGMALMRAFDPAMKKAGTQFGLYGYLDRFMREKTKNILPKVGKGKFEERLYDESGKIKDIEAEGIDAGEAMDAKVAAKAIIDAAPNLRKSLVNEKGEHYITEDITKTIQNAVIKTLGSRLPKASTKEFKLELSREYNGFLRNKIVDMMGGGKVFDTFLQTAYPVVFKYMPKETLLQMERLVRSKKTLAKYPNARQIFATKRRITKPVEVDKLVSEGLLPKDVSRTSGPNLLTKSKVPSTREIMAFYRGKYKDPITGKTESMLEILGYEVNESQLNNRKSKLAGEIGINLAFDMTIETMRLPEVMEKRRVIENTTSEQAKIDIAEVAKTIDRNPDYKYSKNKAEISKEKLPTLKEQKAIEKAEKLKTETLKYFKVERSAQEQMLWLMNEVRIRTRDGVFDKKGKLLSIYKDTKLTKGAVDMVLYLDNKGKIYPEPHKVEIAEQHKYVQGLESGVRSGVFETIPIQYGLLLGKPYGLKMLTDKVTEGGYPDFHSLIHDNPFNVEVKMFNSQLPRTAVGETLNFTTGKHSFKGGDSYNAQMQNMLAEGAAGRKKWADFVLKEMQALGINIKEITNKTQVPAEVFEKAGITGENLQAGTQVTKPFENGLDYIRDKYLAKVLKDGTEVSNHYIEIQSILGKELGLYRIHDFNPLNLNVPKLDAKVDLKLRFSASSTNPVKAPKGYEKFHKTGQKYYSASMSFIPSMNMRSITKSSPYSISVRSKFLKMLKSPEFAKLKELNPKEVTQKITKQIQNVLGPNYKMSKSTKKEMIDDMRTIDNAVKLSRSIKRKKKGMSAWDFDDTLATTKSGVRATIPNPSGLPKPKRKVVFLAGGAGSGKGNVIKKLQLEKQGFKIVNSDISLEWLKKNSGLPESMNDLTKEQKSTLGTLGHQARGISKRKMMKFQGNAEGVVVDGTGGSIKAMEKLVNGFKDKGYDVSMVFVETSLKTALQRNKLRKERSLLDKIVERNHEAVQGNKSGFKTMFAERFMEVKTDNLKQKDAMPSELVDKMNSFVSGYEKIRLDAEQFANEGQSILDKGGEFDFSEFNKVVEGTQGPMFKTAMSRANKFGTKDTYILTARPPEAVGPIHEFLKSQGLEIPIENITGLGNSTGEAKAMWMLKKFEEGYNDMYFADDAMQNVEAVKNVLSQLDVKSKVQQAMRGEDVKIQSTESVKDVDRLDAPENYDNIKYSKSHRSEYEKTISKHRPDLVKEGLVSKTVDNMFEFIDGLNVPDSKKRKYEQVTTKWLATSNIKLREDAYKIQEAVELAEKHKEDIFSYKNPNELIEKYAGKSKEKPTDPKTVKEFAKGTVTNKKHGITEHEVADTREGQTAVRKVMDTHFGSKSNPWCLAARSEKQVVEPRQYGYELAATKQEAQTRKEQLESEGFIVEIRDRGQNIKSKPLFKYELDIKEMSEGPGEMEDAWQAWETYSKGPKSMVFQNGKLIAFKANEQYWDRMDNATDAPVITMKEGRVTKKVELVPIGKGKVQEFVRETRTVSKDKNTVTTEYATETEYYEAGATVVENRVNGITVKKTTSRPTFDKQGNDIMQVIEVVNFDKKGKATNNKNFEDGELIAINTYGRPFGEMKPEQIVKEKGDQIEFMGTNRFGRGDYFVEALVGGKVTEIGFQLGRGVKLESVIKTSPDGKIRLDLNKVLKVDPDVKGIPGEKGHDPVTYMYSKSKKNLSKDFNNILEESYGIGAEKTYSEAKAKLVGRGKGKYKVFGTPGAEDFMGLSTYAFSGKGKQGEAHQEFFREHLEKPFSRAYNEVHSRKQGISNDYKTLRKVMPNVRKKLNEVVDGVFTVDQAIRVHLWDKAGFEVPGLSKADLKTLTEYVRKDGELTLFAEQLSQITMLKDGYIKPESYWLGENITMDMNNVVDRIYKKEALAEFVENREAIFGEWKGGKIVGDNMNKIESILGPKHREALENMLWRMENGTNRAVGADSNTNKWMNWVNSATGTIMFFNQKSAVLQTISSLNYVNGTFNNPLRAAQAFANQPQYWKDFAKIFNSDMLVQRRSGLKINIEAAELLERVGGGEGGFAKFRAFLLEKGFIPTKYADSFAIASGGATFYRNSIRKYKKQGLSTKEAEAKAWEDFASMTEQTQQSSRPDLISMQQASALGRPILAFANTPMQMFRRHKRRIQDIANNRGNTPENVASALYYGFAQTLIFSYLANAMFAVDDESDDPEDIKFAEKKKSRHVNTILDSYLRGMGTGGATVSALKNSILSFEKESEKDYNADYGNTVIDMLNVSPPIGSKMRKIYGALKTYKSDKEVMGEMGLSLDNPAVLATANVISAFTNIPTDRVVMKLTNIKDATTGDFENWQRIAMFMGINKWSLGEYEDASDVVKSSIKKTKKEEKKKIKLKEKEEEDKAIEEGFEKDQRKERKEGKKNITCSAVSGGRRCKLKPVKGGKCTIHEAVKLHPSGKEVQCRKRKSDGTRCKVKTKAKNAYCYYHD
jgi:predicted kinase